MPSEKTATESPKLSRRPHLSAMSPVGERADDVADQAAGDRIGHGRLGHVKLGLRSPASAKEIVTMSKKAKK